MHTTNGSNNVNDGQRKQKRRVLAGACPQSPRHENTRVYNTRGATRYCCCDDCGHTWKVIGPTAPEATSAHDPVDDATTSASAEQRSPSEVQAEAKPKQSRGGR